MKTNDKLFDTDFDKVFEQYIIEWYNQHRDEYEDVSEIEAILPEIYDKWANEPSEMLDGVSPKGFFDAITSPKLLVDMLIENSIEDKNPCSLLLDRIAGFIDCNPYLENILKGEYSTKQKILASNLIIEMDGKHPIDTYADWISGSDDELADFAVEILSECADLVSESLFNSLDSMSFEQRTRAAEVLINAKKDERTFTLLMDLFSKKENIPLFAGYLGKYGDERCVGELYKTLDNCNYLEYIEIKNAIERLGGIVDDDRDFSDDKYYKALKGLK